MKLTTSLIALCAVAMTDFASAQEQRRSAAESAYVRLVFARSDRDGNGVVVAEEFPGSDEQFVAIDRNRNRKIEPSEWERSAMANDLVRARRANERAPRLRQDPIRLRMERLQNLSRFDRDRNGRIDRDEWLGTDRDFRNLDLDDNGRLDKNDRVLSQRAVARALPAEPRFQRRLRSAGELLEQFDQNGNGSLSQPEVRKSDFAHAFEWADQDLDGELSRAELERLARKSNQDVEQRRLGRARPQAFRPPFSAWDKDKNGRLETAEFLERKYLFPRIDQDRDASITREEIERYARSVEKTGFLDRFDLNDDGRVTFEEFGGPRGAFRRADTNGDGVVTKRDR
ncbi:MAG: hypothetical protein AAF196_04605 [Planctomycetota bacterium]